MASLLQRMNVSAGNVGPVRTTRSTRKAVASATPYDRAGRPSKGDADGQWTHDMYQTHNSLSARLGVSTSAGATSKTRGVPKIDFGAADKALRQSSGTGELTIKGAGSALAGNVVEVKGLAKGTTAADVEAVFKHCGPITKSSISDPQSGAVRLVFKDPKHARGAVEKFNNQHADGRVLSVVIVGGTSASLTGRLGVGITDGSADALIAAADSGSSKLRSDEILRSDPRAQIVVAPPGTNPADYTQRPNRGGRGRAGRGARGRGRRGGGRMDVD